MHGVKGEHAHTQGESFVDKLNYYIKPKGADHAVH